MGRGKTAQRIFISRAHANVRVARTVKAALQNAGHDSWLDDSNIHVGVLLRKELQQAIAESRAVVPLARFSAIFGAHEAGPSRS